MKRRGYRLLAFLYSLKKIHGTYPHPLSIPAGAYPSMHGVKDHQSIWLLHILNIVQRFGGKNSHLLSFSECDEKMDINLKI